MITFASGVRLVALFIVAGIGSSQELKRKCDVPDDWFLKFDKNSTSGQTFYPGTIWPGAVVHYSLHNSLSAADRTEVQRAFDDYHRKTCIRFVPRTTQAAFVSIEVDNNVCGLAEVCRTGRSQFARFGGGCRSTYTMIHELGHSLCAGHEMSRYDRDNYVHFSGCASNDIPGKYGSNHITFDLYYDYTSVMAYQCGWCLGGWPRLGSGDIRCDGDAGTRGLSVLDAEKMNAMYNCAGCYSHRFRPHNKLTSGDRAALIRGGTNIGGVPLYICRTYFTNGDIIVGTGNLNDGACYVPFGTQEHRFTTWEVLTNPKSASYRWVQSNGASIPANAVAGGRTKTAETLFIGRTSLSSGGRPTTVVGKIHASRPNVLFVPLDGREHQISNNFEVLVCG